MENTVYERAKCILSFPINNGIYIHNTDKDSFFSIEEGVPTFLWEKLDGSTTIKEITLELVKQIEGIKYEYIINDILEFVEQLLNEGLINTINNKEKAGS